MPKKSTWPRVISVGSVSVKVYEVNHPTNATGKAYVVAYRTPSGRKTVKFADSGAALEEARLQAGKLAAGKIEAADVTGSEREELHAARRVAGDVPLLAALNEWAKARKLVGADIVVACEHWKARTDSAAGAALTVAEVVKRFLHYKQTAERVNTKAGYERTLPGLVKAIGSHAIGAVTPDTLDAYLAKFANAGSRNSHRTRIVTLWKWARMRGFLPLDVLTAAERTAAARRHRVEIGLVTAEQLQRAFALVQSKAPTEKVGEYVPALALAAHCGLRRAEVHGQKWEDIDLDRKLLRVSAAKPNTPARRLVPICEQGVAWLAEHRKAKGPLCSNLAVDRIRDICRTAELDLADNGLRHSFISARVAITGNVNETSLEAGNTPQVLHAHYRELMRKDEAEAWFAVSPTALPEPMVNVKN